jgi:hypothetical protein
MNCEKREISLLYKNIKAFILMGNEKQDNFKTENIQK